MRKQKVRKVGYALRINRTGESGESNWEKVGVFTSRYEAQTERDTKYANVKRATITGVRVNVEPLTAPTNRE